MSISQQRALWFGLLHERLSPAGWANNLRQISKETVKKGTGWIVLRQDRALPNVNSGGGGLVFLWDGSR